MPYDVIVLTETWLKEDLLTSQIFDSNLYNVFRKDRCTKTTGLKRGGGVLIAIRSNISVNSYALGFMGCGTRKVTCLTASTW